MRLDSYTSTQLVMESQIKTVALVFTLKKIIKRKRKPIWINISN